MFAMKYSGALKKYEGKISKKKEMCIAFLNLRMAFESISRTVVSDKKVYLPENSGSTLKVNTETMRKNIVSSV